MKRTFLCFVLVINVFVLVPYAQAGIISGTVRRQGELQREKIICIERGQDHLTIKTDRNGKYRIFLKPGQYRFKLESCDSAMAMEVRSYRESIEKDLNF